jgi:thioredoxin 1
MSGALIDLTEASFAGEIAKGVTLVDFWAPWCGPCRMQTPILEQLAPQLAGKVRIGKVNVDENPGVAGEFGVTGIPTLIVFKNGAEVERFVGVQPAEVLKDRLALHMA